VVHIYQRGYEDVFKYSKRVLDNTNSSWRIPDVGNLRSIVLLSREYVS